MIPAALALLLLAGAAAQAPNTTQGGAPCASDWDCSLGGTCTDAACVCDVWWTGASCALLNLAPADPAASGLVAPGYFSWGGHPLQAADGTYHLLASFLCDHATLDSWTIKSSIAHATAAAPEGPYTFAPGVDSQLVVPPWSHGASVTRDPATGEYLLFHIGDGRVSPSTWSPCYTPAEDAPAFAAAALAAAATPRAPLPGARARAGEDDTTYVERAPTLAGPWTPYNNNLGLDVVYPPGSWATSMTNPAAFIFPNGTTLLYYRADQCPETWGALAPACIGVAIADSWQGPYTSLFDQPITHPEGEDPAVFRDPRGNMHMLTNVNTYHARCAAGVPCGGHAWSRDGLTWSNQTVGAFGPVIRWTNGSYLYGAYAERPQVLQAADGTPVSFHTGFGQASYTDSHNFAQLFCTPGRADCGPTHPPAAPTVALAQHGACLTTNASFPCAGGHADSCPLALGACSDPMAAWTLQGSGTLGNAKLPGSVTNVDCDACAAGSVLKVTSDAQYNDGVALDAAAGELRSLKCPGFCLSGTTAQRNPPCEGGEWTAPAQVALVACGTPEAGGWTSTPVA